VRLLKYLQTPRSDQWSYEGREVPEVEKKILREPPATGIKYWASGKPLSLSLPLQPSQQRHKQAQITGE
jgi:hypothetical protein